MERFRPFVGHPPLLEGCHLLLGLDPVDLHGDLRGEIVLPCLLWLALSISYDYLLDSAQ